MLYLLFFILLEECWGRSMIRLQATVLLGVLLLFSWEVLLVEGLAVGIEHIPELATWSIENLKSSAAASFLEKGSLSVHNGDVD